MSSVKVLLVNSLKELGKDLKEFRWFLNNKGIPKYDLQNADVFDIVDKMVDRFGPKEAVLITVDILRKMNQNLLSEQLKKKYNEGSPADSITDLHDYSKISYKLKNKLRQNYEQILVGNSQRGHRLYLNNIYTDLDVVENETGGIVNEHEVRQIEFIHSRSTVQDTVIQCNDMFKVQSDMGQQNKKVLTMGIAGVGKTVSVNKFILDWAEGKDNQDIVLIFPLPFRELNLIKKKYSLMELLNKYFFSGSEELSSLPEDDSKVMFIFDGLDECRFPLNFKQGDRFTNVHEKTTVSKIVTNLIKRRLVSSALIWITSRPAAAGLIPRDYIDQVTEVRGFNDEQKEQYFIKNSSPEVAGNIIRHVRKSRSLYIMCHIPVFCWISLTVLQPLLARESNDKTPTTLTEMYINFLFYQNQQMKKRFLELKPKVKSFDEIILKLGKLAFKQLQKGNLIFYKEDLEKCGLDVSEGSVYSGLCTQIFLEENAVSERKVYSFVHLSIQEFLAALYVLFKYKCYGRNAFLRSERKRLSLKPSKTSLFELHEFAICKALQSKNGHLDLFLRFLLGLSLESNQNYLKELLPRLETKPVNVKDTVDYIKRTIETEKSVERIINLFHCLVELKDDFMEDIQKYLSSGNLSEQNLSSAQWSGLVFVRLMSDEKFELQEYSRSEEVQGLPVTHNTRKALVDHGGEIGTTAGLQTQSSNSLQQSTNTPTCCAFMNYEELFPQDACDLTLDLNTANTRLFLYEENRKVKHVKENLSYPDHPERFKHHEQVLCVESLTGCCYWEVEWSGWVNIAVTYKGINRKGGSDCSFGSNDKSWSLNCFEKRFTVRHNNNDTDILAPSPQSDRVGVCVDVSAGSLSFYSVSDTHTLTHLHTFNTTFTEPLYAGFRVDYASSVSLCQIKGERHIVKTER
ncbi:NLR family CARD domain-containing protein 3 [Labeo rohita]|uniref:NLR family CARD domain-containing protein 3 n=1 Tax=Labeo rohita TaxID=84645 RepID=A0ABQ8N1I7_LABRO|nr:protein NLRC3 [Labeo rohita]KAI2668959.1 NLR family CARD domain-containing protein 3 [Labeo rohita]